MAQNSVVYGCIRDQVFVRGTEQALQRRQINRDALANLPSVEEWPLLAREMFALPAPGMLLEGPQVDVVAFGGAYRGVEYEWEQWIDRFESLLSQMYWVSATVHLETELSGVHTFTWEANASCHEPNSGPLAMRCEWSRESVAL